jgi:hypothetical protein
MHAVVKPSRMNRIAISKFFIDHCLTAEQRKGMKLRNIIYKPGEPFAFIGLQYPGSYQTQGWAASELQRLYAESLTNVHRHSGSGNPGWPGAR